MASITLAQVAYEAYAEHQQWVNYQGTPIPPWEGVREDIKDAWATAVSKVLEVCEVK